MLDAHKICHVRDCGGGKGYSEEDSQGLLKPAVSLATVSGGYHMI